MLEMIEQFDLKNFKKYWSKNRILNPKQRLKFEVSNKNSLMKKPDSLSLIISWFKSLMTASLTWILLTTTSLLHLKNIYRWTKPSWKRRKRSKNLKPNYHSWILWLLMMNIEDCFKSMIKRKQHWTQCIKTKGILMINDRQFFTNEST